MPLRVSCCLLATALTLTLLTNFAPADFSLSTEEGALSLDCDGIRIQHALPIIDCSINQGKTRVKWRPEKTPQVRSTQTSTPLGPGQQTTFTWRHSEGLTLDWIITRLMQSKGCTVQVCVTNQSPTGVLVNRIDVLHVPSGSLSAEGSESNWMTSSRYLKYARYYDSLADLRSRGQLVADRSEPDDVTREVPYQEDFCLYTDNGRSGMSISAVTDQAYNNVTLHVPNGSVELGLNVWSEMTGVLVDSGESRLSERVLIQAGPWREAGEKAVAWMRSVLKPRDTPPVYGWCSWYCAGGNVTEEHCFKAAELVSRHQDRYPFETMQVDEGWHIGRHCWYPNEKFLSGTQALADKFKSAGGIAGVWMTPISPNSARVVDGKFIPTGGQGGTAARVFDPSWHVGYRQGRRGGKLDPSSPPAAEYIQGELRRLFDLGYRYFKTDFSLVDALPAGYHDPKLTSFQAQRLLYSLIREAIGEESYLLACNGGPARVVAGLADATRIGTDSGTKWGFCQDQNDFGKPANVHGAWFPILQIGCASAYTGLIACDPDVTRLDNLGYANYDPRFNGRDSRNPEKPMPVKLSMQSVQTFHGIQGLYGGTMMISDLMYEPGYQADNRLRMAEIMHPVTPELGYNFAGGSDVLCHQFGFSASRLWGDWVSMVTWNPDHRGKKDLRINHAPLKRIGQKFHLWSFWDEQYLGVQDVSYEFKDVKNYHSKLLRLTPVREDGVPTLVGSNLHMAMGATEIKRIDTEAEGMLIELHPSAGALEGQLVVTSPQPLEIEQVVGCRALVTKSGPGVYTVLVAGRDREARQSLSLKVTGEEPPTLESIKASDELRPLWKAGSMLPLLD